MPDGRDKLVLALALPPSPPGFLPKGKNQEAPKKSPPKEEFEKILFKAAFELGMPDPNQNPEEALDWLLKKQKERRLTIQEQALLEQLLNLLEVRIGNQKITLDQSVVKHSNLGDFPINPTKKGPKYQTMKGGGHGQDNIDFLTQYGFDYNIVHTYSNGVRIGNVLKHKNKLKRTGTGQSWFPDTWTELDIRNAGEYVINNTENFVEIPDGQSIYKNCKGVRIGVIKTSGKPGTIFPDGIKQPSLEDSNVFEEY